MSETRAIQRLGLLSTTLTELLLFVFFVVLLLGQRFYAVERRQQEELRAAAGEAEAQAERAAAAQARAEAERATALAESEAASALLLDKRAYPERFDELVREAIRARAQTGLLETRLQQAEQAMAEQQAASRQARAALAEQQARADALAAAVEREAGTEARTAAERLAGEVARRSAERDAVRDQLEFLRASTGAGGMDHPPCWLDPATRKVEYLLEVEVGEEALQVRPAWPARRDAEARALPAVARLLGSAGVGPQAFSAEAAPLLAWCRQQEPECRHYVRVRDRAVSKQAFKAGLLAVESAFYKYLVR
jgi:hypothetical protein